MPKTNDYDGPAPKDKKFRYKWYDESGILIEEDLIFGKDEDEIQRYLRGPFGGDNWDIRVTEVK